MNRNQKIKLYLLVFIASVLILFALNFPRLTLPFGLAYITYLIFRPIVTRLMVGTLLQRLGYWSFIFFITIFILIPPTIAIYNLDTNIGTFVQETYKAQQILQQKFLYLKSIIFEKYGFKLNIDPFGFITSQVETFASDFLLKIPIHISMFLEWIFLVPLFLFFLFRQSDTLTKRFMEIVPNPFFEKSYVLFSQFNTKFGEYIVAKFIEATILGGLVTLGLLMVGFPYPFILGLFAGITNILPYIGPILGVVPALMIAFMSNDPNLSTMAMIFVYVVANIVDLFLIFPLLVSKIVNLHPVLVVMSIIIGSQLGGVIGMIVIIPFVAFFKLLLVEIYKDLSVHI